MCHSTCYIGRIIVRMFKNVIFYSSALKIFESGKFYTETNDEKNIVFNKSMTSLLIDRIKLFTKS